MLRKSELLAAVIQRLSDPSHWIQYRSAESAEGFSTSPTDPEAVSWCLTGAVRRELHEHGLQVDHLTHEMYRDLSAEFAAQFPGLWPWLSSPQLVAVRNFNDHPQMTHADLLAVLEKTWLTLVERGE